MLECWVFDVWDMSNSETKRLEVGTAQFEPTEDY